MLNNSYYNILKNIQNVKKFRYNMSFYEVNNYFLHFLEKYPDIVKLENSAKTFFGFDINTYKIGNGKKHIIFIGATHSVEIITVYFLMDLFEDILQIVKNQKEIFEEYTFHFIPILNPEGTYITFQNIYKNFNKKTNYEIEQISKKYLNVYNFDDENAKKSKVPKQLYNVIDSRLEHIDNIYLQNSVRNILNDCSLDERYILVWNSNGNGIDLNSNSPHKFNQMKILRNFQKYAYLRYNDIPVTKPSPMSYPGKFSFDRCPENIFLYNYLSLIYFKNNLKYIFSFHSTGGQIYTYPDEEIVSYNVVKRYEKIMKKYGKITSYEIMEDEKKLGFMDFCRARFLNTTSLTIELSKYNANPIGPLFDISKLEEEYVKNKEAIFKCILDD